VANKNDFEDRFFTLLEGTIQGIDKKVDKLGSSLQDNTNETRKINSRVAKLENTVFPSQTQQTAQDLPSWWRDPNIIKLLSLVFGAIIIILTLYAALKGIKVPGGL